MPYSDRSSQDAVTAEDAFRKDVLTGLAATPKTLFAKYFYDDEGSRLFDEICLLEEYYPTRTEIGLMERHGRDIAKAVGEGSVVVELGSGSSVKIRLLLQALKSLRAYLPVDISEGHLRSAVRSLQGDFQDLDIHPIAADFTQSFDLPEPYAEAPLLGFFPGSTIGNFAPEEALAFLTRLHDILKGGKLLIGVDRKKDPAVLHAAYNDKKGVTAAFNKNLLVRINRELAGNLDPRNFDHWACYNPFMGRIEMHLVSRLNQTVRVFGQAFHFEEGETLHTESSYKYTPMQFGRMAGEAGWQVQEAWSDPDSLFTIYLLEAQD